MPSDNAAKAQQWRRRALEFEAAHDLPSALDAYQSALGYDPYALDIAGHLASLAFRLKHWDMAEKLYAHLIRNGQQDVAALKAYAATLREQSRFDEAIDLLKSVLAERPGEAPLWDALGTILTAKGDSETALIFFEEALRLAPDDLHALFNRGCAKLELGDTRAGLADVAICAGRFSDPGNRASAEITCAQAALALGDLDNGWRWFEARHKRGTVHEVLYDLDVPRWTGEPVAGRRLFVSAEQGLGDEVLLGSLLPDIVRDLGPEGHLGIGVEPRLVPLFQRSFPDATIVAHRTQTVNGRVHRAFPELNPADFDLYALMGDFLATKRGKISDFPAENRFLKPSPTRLTHWQTYLAALGPKPKIGLLWKSLKSDAQRDRYFSPFRQWEDVLRLDATFIALQYGDISAERAHAREASLNLHVPEGIDLKQDLDDLAALCSGLDLILGPPNATSNIAVACGVKTWMLSTPGTWLKLGQAQFPWYPSARAFAPQSVNDWGPVMADIQRALTSDFRIAPKPY